MTPRTLRVLEFDAIRDRVAARCVSALGRERAAALVPVPLLEDVERSQRETTEARALAEDAGGLPVRGIVDIRDPVRRASIGGVLDARELLTIRDTAAVARTLKGFISSCRTEAPVIAEMADGLGVFSELEDAIGGAISPEGEILDGASPDLARLRRERRTAEGRLRGRLDELLRTPSIARMLREPLITLRGERHTVPVRAEFRNSFPGVAHDQSSSGVTVFMEPLAVVPLANQVRELALGERDEIARILAALSGAVGAAAGEFEATLELLGALDLAAAKARLSIEMDAAAPRLNAAGAVDLRRARHPLLPAGAVPIDVQLGKRFRTLIITGPNTGGKTVTLKTVGLLALMAQAGLHIPAAPDSEVAVFPQIYADIGDEQSIAQNLSTFSSHLGAIVEILRALGSPRGPAHALVLLDEVGAGTDPTEGVALARALIETLHGLGVCLAVTTHYNELKAMAYTHPGMENASVEFDDATLRPTYRLLTGTPGRSNAFAIAERLGLDPEIVARARDAMSRRDADMTRVFQSVEDERRALLGEREALARDRAAVERLRARVQEDARRLETERRGFFERAREDVAALVRRGRQELDAVLDELRTRPSQQAASRVRLNLQQLSRAAEGYGAQASEPPPGPAPEDLEPGEGVFVVSLKQRGTVQAAADTRGEVEVQVGAMKLRVPAEDLRRLPGGEEAAGQTAPAGGSGFEKSVLVSSTLDLRGLRAEDAIEELDKYLDDATLAGLAQVTVIHGKGTGALRQVVREHLAIHPEVAAFRHGAESEGGSGATIVELARR